LGGGLSVTLETLEAKVKIGGYFRGVKCNFPKKKIKRFVVIIAEGEEEAAILFSLSLT
jgi:hypothetical protein